MQTNNCIATLTEHKFCIQCLVELKNGLVLSGSVDGDIKVWDMSRRICISTIEMTNSSYIVLCLLELENSNLASGSSDNSIKIFKKNTVN